MQTTATLGTPWQPSTVEDHSLVRAQMDSVLASKYFSRSKRLPAFLEYVVKTTLDGHGDDLKERTVGVALFNRPLDYDTGSDPIVRVTAAEVRKRISQYYDFEGGDAVVRIDLPPGSYVPEFHLVSRDFPVDRPLERPVTTPPAEPVVKPSKLRLLGAIGVVGVVLAGGLAAYWTSHRPMSQWKQLWSPLFASTSPIMIVVAPPVQPASVRISQNGNPSARGSQVALQDALAVANLCGLLKSNGKPCSISPANTLSLSDFRKNSALLVGGINNLWTMRLTSPLRFYLANGPAQPDETRQPVRYILDRTHNESTSNWSLDPGVPRDKITVDYSIIARFHSESTDDIVFVAAGLGSIGTSSAVEFATSADDMQELATHAPAHWEKQNMEVVLETEVVDGHAGHTKVVASTFW
jgi:hypothetical protein